MQLPDAAGRLIESVQPSLPDEATQTIPLESAVSQAVCRVPDVTVAKWRPPPSDMLMTRIGEPPPTPAWFATHQLIALAITLSKLLGKTTSEYRWQPGAYRRTIDDVPVPW